MITQDDRSAAVARRRMRVLSHMDELRQTLDYQARAIADGKPCDIGAILHVAAGIAEAAALHAAALTRAEIGGVDR